ncbi:hypothetical protein GCM10022243_25300 [Saccharothrix violaceirubra]|uniref:DUF4192 domain-containing protein n=1 Tax=Saccharothrix violaceirubra TaxID=413306 RepID=A0A7W7SZ72_9PSEU|nr:DUF4192 domain-containing protein [Saccharothrix violaceirubra]MBB4963550.1 hypothetical protein [Saccharothrix violaceirubra]
MSEEHIDVRCDTEDLIAGLPHLIGFYPVESLVCLAVRGDRMTWVMRLDLTATDRQIAAAVVTRLQSGGCDSMVAVVVGDHHATRRHHDRVTALAEVLSLLDMSLEGFGVPEVAAGAEWFSYDDPSIGGALPEPGGTRIAMLTALRGYVTYPDRDAMRALVAPADDATLARRAKLIGEAERRWDEVAVDAWPGRPDEPCTRADKLALVTAQVDAVPERSTPLTDGEIADLAWALSDMEVRDACFALVVGPRARDAERLWSELIRECPPPWCAEAAVLFGVSVILRGDGVLATFALERAQTAHPGHRLSHLVVKAMAAGMSPDRLRSYFSDRTQD